MTAESPEELREELDEVLPVEAPEQEESFFLKLADKVSWGMGTPTNIGAWLLAVGIWFALGVLFPSLWTKSQFLPSWFTSTSWNFPLNTVTTLAELYIGFLVAAATNRTERANNALLDRIELTEALLLKEQRANTNLTREVHDLQTRMGQDVALLNEVHAHVTSLTTHFHLDSGNFDPPETPQPEQVKRKYTRKPKEPT